MVDKKKGMECFNLEAITAAEQASRTAAAGSTTAAVAQGRGPQEAAAKQILVVF